MLVNNGDVALHVEVDGPADAPPVVLLHGITSSTRTWDWLVPSLAVHHRVLRLDFRGHGGSDRAPGAYDVADYVSDAVATCEQVAGGPAALIGHSLGGATVAALAQHRPELVAGALLEDPPIAPAEHFRILADGGPETNALWEGFALMRRSVPGLQATGMSVEGLASFLAAAPSPAGGTFGDQLLPDGVASMAAGLLRVDAAVLDPVLDGTATFVYDPDRPVDVPLTVVAADPASADAVTRPADLDQLTTVSPHARCTTVQGAGHMIHDTHVGRPAFVRIVEEFLATLRSG